MRRRRDQMEKGGIEIVGDAVDLLRQAPRYILAGYFVGSVPFVLALLFFWSDMSRSAFAASRCFRSALMLAGLFVWMKCWHTWFARQLLDVIGGRAPERVTAGQGLRIVAFQLALQPYGLLAIPAAMVLAVPFPVVYGFYQNLTVLGDGRRAGVREIAREAWGQALLWPRQGLIALWLLCPWVLAAGMLASFGVAKAVLALSPGVQDLDGTAWFGLSVLILFMAMLPLCPFGSAVAGNVALSLVSGPQLLHSLTGMQTAFSLSGTGAILNTTFLLTVYGIAYLCLDPLIKVVYALRCFYGRSLRTGEHLLAQLRAGERGARLE